MCKRETFPLLFFLKLYPFFYKCFTMLILSCYTAINKTVFPLILLFYLHCLKLLYLLLIHKYNRKFINLLWLLQNELQLYFFRLLLIQLMIFTFLNFLNFLSTIIIHSNFLQKLCRKIFIQIHEPLLLSSFNFLSFFPFKDYINFQFN